MTADLPIRSHQLIDTYSSNPQGILRPLRLCRVFAHKVLPLLIFSKRVSLWGDLSRVSPKTDKGIYFPRNDLNYELVQCVHIHINLFIDMSHTWPFHYKHATTISESKHYTGSLILRPFLKLHRLWAYMSAYEFQGARCKTLIRNNTRNECNCWEGCSFPPNRRCSNSQRIYH